MATADFILNRPDYYAFFTYSLFCGQVVRCEDMDYDILPFPSDRKVILDAGHLASRRHIVYDLLEVAVTYS